MRGVVGWLVIVLAALVACPQLGAADPTPPLPDSLERGLLFRESPHDLLRVRGEAQTPLKVLPIDLPGRRIPAAPNPRDVIHVRLVDQPAQTFAVEWRHVDQLVLFEDRVLTQAGLLVDQRQFDSAYEVLNFLQLTYPRTTGLAELSQRFLHEQAKSELEQKHDRAALALFLELAGKQPTRPGLSDELAELVDRLIDASVEKHDPAAGRQFVASFLGHYPQHARITEWRKRFAAAGRERLESARRALAEQRPAVARQALKEALALVPDLQDAQPVIDQLGAGVAAVAIGVRTPPRDQPALAPLQRLLDPAARRDNRLLERSLIELVGIGADGGNYRPLVGKLERDLNGNLSWQLPTSGDLTGFDVARQLAQLADPRRHTTSAWSMVLDSLSVHDVFRVDAKLRAAHVLPEALIARPMGLAASSPSTAFSAQVHPYTAGRRSAQQLSYRLDPRYEPRTETTPLDLTAHWFEDDAAAANALLRGTVDLLDYVPPWEIDEWTARRDFAVEPYRVPTMHLLIVNRTHPWLRARSFRRALIYALDRNDMLAKLVLRGKKLPGAEVHNGPFPRGVDGSDPLGYAFNPLLKPRPYDPGMAGTLLGLTQTATNDARPLRFRFPSTPVARLAARAIAQQWKALGVSVELDELPAGDAGWSDPGDVLYAEVSMSEPLVDARTLLGPGSIAGGNVYVTQALEQLDRVTEWSEARRVLQLIQQLVYDDATLIPLWQLNDHYVRSTRLNMRGARPMTLYQHVEQWQVTLAPPLAKDPLWPEVAKQP